MLQSTPHRSSSTETLGVATRFHDGERTTDWNIMFPTCLGESIEFDALSKQQTVC